MIKRAARAMLRRAGYDLRRIPGVSSGTRGYPFVSKCEIAGIHFPFWVHDSTAEQWYLPEQQSSLVENELLAGLVLPGERVLDVGCHHGFYLAFLAKLVGPEGFVLGVDINPENVMIAQAQLALNKITAYCEVLHRGVSDSVEDQVGYSRSTNSVVVVSEQGRAGTAEATTVDRLCADYGDFDVLMIDVEGFEEKVLKGAREFLDRRKPKLAVEIHSDNLAQYGCCLGSLASAGRFIEYGGQMVLRSVNRHQNLPFRVEAVPINGITNTFLSCLAPPRREA